MLYFLLRPQREPLEMIEVRMSLIPYVVIEHVTEYHD